MEIMGYMVSKNDPQERGDDGFIKTKRCHALIGWPACISNAKGARTKSSAARTTPGFARGLNCSKPKTYLNVERIKDPALSPVK